MGLKADLLDAILQASFDAGIEEPPDLSDGTFPERLAHYQTEAIAKFLTEAEFTITQLNAPVIIEDFNIPEQGVNIELQTLLGDKAPILDAIKKIPGGEAVVAPLESALRKAVAPLLEAGSKLPALNLGKDSGGLSSTGYVYIGKDPDSQDDFDVEDQDGQRDFTTVKLLRENIEDLL